MVFYRIKIKSFPEINFACITRIDKYKNIINKRKNLIEMSVNSEAIEFEQNGKKNIKPKHSFSINMPDMSIKAKALNENILYIGSIAIKADFDFERVECKTEEESRQAILKSEDCLVLPQYIELESDFSEIERMFRRVVLYFPKEDMASKMKAMATIYEIFAIIDEKLRNRVMNKQEESIIIYYSKKAKKYIEAHFSKNIKVKDIADELNISPNYLSNIFRHETGQTITEYISRIRLEKARIMLYEDDLNIDEVAKKVGISGGVYLNELFKKYYGFNIHKCILADREISLYHQKPWDIENLKEDIFNTEKGE